MGDRFGMAYYGTAVIYGRGSGVVVATGRATEIGRISEMLAAVQNLTTPLLARLDTFARWLTVVIIVLAGGTFAFGVLVRAYPGSEMFLAAVGLIVAAIPEGLPAIITITLAIGVQRMAHRNAIIRRLPAVETLGAVTVICSDKTGTLTRNEMMVRSIVIAGRTFEVAGHGYDPHGAILAAGEEVAVEAHPALQELARAALLCNDAVLEQRGERWRIQGDPTEGALLTLAGKLGLDSKHENQLRPRSDVIPFESERRFMATLHHDHAGHGFIYLKGAPEGVLEMCSRQRCHDEDAPLERSDWLRAAEDLARRGQRLLAVAVKPFAEPRRDLAFADVENGLTLLGLFGIADPPRPEAIEAVAAASGAVAGTAH
jgi:magnesium-transporting ATPase (P-type)